MKVKYRKFWEPKIVLDSGSGNALYRWSGPDSTGGRINEILRNTPLIHTVSRRRKLDQSHLASMQTVMIDKI